MPHISWSPRVQPELIRRLYEADASGVPDVELCDDVGVRLYLRCESIVRVLRGEVECPTCGTVYRVTGTGNTAPVPCPTKDCDWSTTVEEYRLSWSKRRIYPGKAIPAFLEFHERYPSAKSYAEKIVLIDRLIHAFHWDLVAGLPNRSVANNLIEGNHDQVVAFLDRLSGGDSKVKAQWQKAAGLMMKRRKGR